MKAADTIRLVNLLQPALSKENAEKVVEILSDKTEADEKYLTKQEFYKEISIVKDKIDTSAKWIIGAIFVMLSLAVAIIKL